MELGIQGKVALITAASKGIGFAAAQALAREGCCVVLCARNAGKLEDSARSLEMKYGTMVLAHPADVTRPDDLVDLFAQINQRFGRLDILVANAGGPPSGDFFNFSDGDWTRAYELTLLSAVRLSRLAAPGMIQRQWGRIVYITSVSVKQPIEGLVLSNALRAAVTGLAKTQAAAWGGNNVLVNCVGPGFTRTDRLIGLYQKEAEAAGMPLEELLRAKAQAIPLKRLAEPEEIGSVIAFLCSEQAAYVTGSSLLVDGGLVKSI